MQHFLLEQALNYLLEQDQTDLAPLNGKTIGFSLEDSILKSLPLTFDFICTNNRIFVTKNSRDGDVNIKLKPDVFLALFKGEDLTELLRQDKIIIHGDVKTAQLLVDLLQQIDIDLEELLSQYTGDIIAHQAGKVAAKFKTSMQDSSNPLEMLKDQLTTLLVAPRESALFKNKGA